MKNSEHQAKTATHNRSLIILATAQMCYGRHFFPVVVSIHSFDGVTMFTFCSSVSTSCFIYSRFMFYAARIKKNRLESDKEPKKKTVTMLRSHTLNAISCFFSCVLYLFIARTSHTRFAPYKQKMSFLRTFAHIEVGTATEYVRLFQVILWKWWDPDDRNATGSLVLQNKNLSFHASHVKSLIVWYFQCIFLAARDFESVIFR